MPDLANWSVGLASWAFGDCGAMSGEVVLKDQLEWFCRVSRKMRVNQSYRINRHEDVAHYNGNNPVASHVLVAILLCLIMQGLGCIGRAFQVLNTAIDSLAFIVRIEMR